MADEQPVLSKGFHALALTIQEAAMMHGDVANRLQSGLDDAHKGTNASAYYLNHSGSGKSGNVVYLKNGGHMQAPYSLGDTTDGSSAKVDIKKEKKVIPTMTYAQAGGEDDEAKEAARTGAKDVRLVESCVISDLIHFRESSGALNPLVKIISAGRGTSGYYTEALLKRDGPEIFKRGTLMYINHATNAEEAARPEGDYTKLAAVTTGDAYWDQNGKDGPALYAPSKVFSGVAAEVKEKAPYTGVSIRASGLYAEAATGDAKKGVLFDESKIAPDGRPGLIGKLTCADSIDLVTKAGRDGKLLLESAVAADFNTGRNHDSGETEMSEAVEKQLRETLQVQASELRKLKERGAKLDAADTIAQYFTTVRVGEAVQREVARTLLERPLPFTGGGDIDAPALTKLAEAETVRELEYIERVTGRKIVQGMGSAAPAQLTEAQRAETTKHETEESASFASLMGIRGKAGQKIVREGRAAFDPNYNSGEREKGLILGTEAA
jgi:hypothetical protein